MIARRRLGAGKFGRPDGLVRFLRILGLASVLARLVGQIARVIPVGHRLARGADRLACHLHPVRTHVSDQPVLVELLGDPHRVACRKPQLARGFLLQRRGGERWRRIARKRLGLGRGHREPPRLDHRLGLVRRALVADRQPVDLPAVEPDQPRRKAQPILLEARADAPIFLRTEQLDLALAVDDQAQRDRLHPACRLGSGKLAPQDRRQGEADQIIQCPPRSISVDQVVIELARAGHRRKHRRLGDLVERHPAGVGRKQLALFQHLLDVPADRFPLAVGVGCKDQRVGRPSLVGDRLQLLRLVGIILPLHREPVIGIDRSVAGRQVANMAIARQHPVSGAEIFLDGLGLGRGFDDDELHLAFSSRIRTRVGSGESPRQAGCKDTFPPA